MGLLARIRGLADSYPGTATLGEISSQPGALERVTAFTEGADRLHMAYTLKPLRNRFDWTTVSDLLRHQASRGTDGWICWSFSNHDVERAVSRWNPAGAEVPADPAFARLLMALLLSLRGSVCLYQGEELGLPEATLTETDLRDPFGIAYWPAFRGRDGSRTPMPWCDGDRHCGFTTAETPWLPVPDEHRPLAVEVQEADENSILHSFRRFLHWRRGVPALMHGSLEPVALPCPLVGLVREHMGGRVLAVFNLSDQPVALDSAIADWGVEIVGSGFEGCIGSDGRLGPFGVLFAEAAEATAAAPLLLSNDMI
jgi:alpha-glucosidase